MLEGSVLVLNRSWVAVHIAPVRRALTLLYIDAARVVHPHDYSLHTFESWVTVSQNGLGGQYLYTPRTRVRVPEVVILNVFNGFVNREVRLSRQGIVERDRHTCQYCGTELPRAKLTLDHVLPQSRGGGESWENLVLACLPCNVRKGNRTPEEAKMPLLKKPAKPAWLPQMGRRVPDDQLAVWRRFVDARQWGLQPSSP